MPASFCVLIPCLNEEAAIAQVVAEVREAVPQARILGGAAFAKVLQLFFGWKPRDIFSGLRLLTRRFYQNTAILGYGFELEIELTVQCLEKGFRLEEVDVPFHVRLGAGVSKLRTVKD